MTKLVGAGTQMFSSLLTLSLISLFLYPTLSLPVYFMYRLEDCGRGVNQAAYEIVVTNVDTGVVGGIIKWYSVLLTTDGIACACAYQTTHEYM